MYDTPCSENAKGNFVSMSLLMQKEIVLNKILTTLFPCILKPA